MCATVFVCVIGPLALTFGKGRPDTRCSYSIPALSEISTGPEVMPYLNSIAQEFAHCDISEVTSCLEPPNANRTTCERLRQFLE